MIAITEGITSDQDLFFGTYYLARWGDRYLVVRPFQPYGDMRTSVPYKEAKFINSQGNLECFTALSELAQIY